MTYKLPEGWKEVELKKVIDVQIDNRGRNPSTYLEYSIYPVIDNYLIKNQRYPDMSNINRYIDEETFNNFLRGYVEKDDVIITLVGNGIGNVSMVPNSNAVIIQNTLGLRCNNNMNNIFLYYSLLYNQNDIKNFDRGTSQPSIRKTDLFKYNILMPPIKEQRVIVDTLSALDDKIENNNKINENLEQQAQAIFKHWFVDFEFPDENGNPYKSSGGEMVESELGMIPKGWEVVGLEDFINFREGPGIRHWQFANEGVKFINIRCIKDNDLELETANKITEEEAYGKYSHFLLKEWDIVISTSGTLGRYAIVRKEHLPLCLNTSVIKFRTKESFDDFSYIYGYLTSLEFYTHLVEKASGSVQVNFGPTHLRKIDMIKPLKSIRNKYKGIMFPIIKKIIENRKQNQKLSELRDTLLPKLMSGELRIPINNKPEN